MAETPSDPIRAPLDWDARFKANETPWERPGLHPAIAGWIASGEFQIGERGIIPGCGRAPELLRLAELGLSMTGIDLSQTAIAWQIKQHEKSGLTASLLAADVLDYEPEDRLDFVAEQTFLCAIPPKLRERYEATAHRWLRPGGRFYALFMQKNERGGPPYACPLDAMQDLFPASRWVWPDEADFIPHPHPSLDGKPELAGILIRK
jgi:SAM-dependent methyltransferase